MRAETAISDAISALDEAERRDRGVSQAWQDAHRFLEMSAVRGSAVRAERRTAVAALAVAAARSADARGVVTTARTAVETVEQLIAERDAASRVREASREQHVLDDIARARLAVRKRATAR